MSELPSTTHLWDMVEHFGDMLDLSDRQVENYLIDHGLENFVYDGLQGSTVAEFRAFLERMIVIHRPDLH